MNQRDKIVVTGIGLVTPQGKDRETSWQKVKDGVSILSAAQPEFLRPELAAKTRYCASLGMEETVPRSFSLALSAAREALAQSGINLKYFSPERMGCSVSASKPVFNPDQKSLPHNIWSRFAADSVLSYLRRELKISGPSLNLIAACATGIHSILTASRWLEEEYCDAAFCGSIESALHPMVISGFNHMGVLSGQPRPFDKRRNGFVMGEGAGILMLERKKDALRRGGTILAELSGCAVGSDTHQPASFQDDGSTVAAVLELALRRSGFGKGQIGYLNAHGTGTLNNDRLETRAIQTVFGEAAGSLSISSTKSSTGHLLGASAGVEAAFACLALRDQFIPPTAHLEESDPDCHLNYTPVKGQSKEIHSAASLSFGFGGAIGAVIFQSPN